MTTAEAGDVKESLKNVREITESIKSLIGTTQGQVAGTGSKVQGSIDRLQNTLDNLDKSMHNIEQITERVNNGEGTVGHIMNDDTIARNVEDITENASTFVRGITKLQTIVGLRSEYNVLASTREELPVDHADAPAGQVLPDRAHRGSARLLEHRHHRHPGLGAPGSRRRPRSRPATS